MPSRVPGLMAAALAAVAAAWVALLVVAAASGRGALPAAVYALSSTVCHQRPERSFALDGRQFPVCARCAGLYVAGAVGAAAGWLGAARAPRRSRALLIAAAVPTALTVPIEWLGVSGLSNAVRAAAALPLGAAAGWIFVRSLRAER